MGHVPLEYQDLAGRELMRGAGRHHPHSAGKRVDGDEAWGPMFPQPATPVERKEHDPKVLPMQQPDLPMAILGRVSFLPKRPRRGAEIDGKLGASTAGRRRRAETLLDRH